MSIGQHVECWNQEKLLCKLELFQGKDNKIALVAMGEEASVCYMLNLRTYRLENDYSAGFIEDAIEMVRVDKVLRARFCESGKYI